MFFFISTFVFVFASFLIFFFFFFLGRVVDFFSFVISSFIYLFILIYLFIHLEGRREIFFVLSLFSGGGWGLFSFHVFVFWGLFCVFSFLITSYFLCWSCDYFSFSVFVSVLFVIFLFFYYYFWLWIKVLTFWDLWGNHLFYFISFRCSLSFWVFFFFFFFFGEGC